MRYTSDASMQRQHERAVPGDTRIVVTAPHPVEQSPPTAELEGSIDHITYQSDETGYTVARLQPARGGETVTVVGQLPGIRAGEAVVLFGWWQEHQRHGRQFKATNYRLMLPATIEGIRKYLGSGLIKGIGPVTADRIVDYFGADTLSIIDSEPLRLREVPSLGPKRASIIQTAWAEQQAIKEVMVLLQGLGVNTGLAVRIFKAYGDASLGIVQHDPYRLARDVWGIGFLTADKIARAIGIPTDAPERIQAGLLHALSRAADEAGHVYLPLDELAGAAADLLELPVADVQASLDRLRTVEHVVIDEIDGVSVVYLTPFKRAEAGVAQRITLLLRSGVDRLYSFQNLDWVRALAWLRDTGGITLAEGQEHAVRQALTAKVAVLTGGPGTGKTTTVRSIIALAHGRRHTVVLAAPTGRAAKRLADLTGVDATTIHRLLELQPGGKANRNEDHPLEADLVIVDEASMLDVLLTNHLLKAIQPGTHLLFVGDVDQLPSVGPGAILHDIIESQQVPVTRLTTIFRQEATSAIITNAHRINTGEMPCWGGAVQDFFFFQIEDPASCSDMIIDLVNRRIPSKFGIPSRDIQVLSPMHRGEVGVGMLNQRLQHVLNPPTALPREVQKSSRTLREGDRVIQMRNNYDLEVYNGDLGRIVDLNLIQQELCVVMDDGRKVIYDMAQADELAHAYAISVHKSQGSEFTAVVIPVQAAHYMLLSRTLIYTAITRARQLVVMVGTQRALRIAIQNNRRSRRYSGLQARLRDLGELLNQTRLNGAPRSSPSLP